MQYTFTLLALAAAVTASPLAFPQAVTAIVTPSGSAPPGCMPTYVGSFGIAVMNISTASVSKRAVSQSSSGQPQAYTMAPVSQISDGQVQGGMHTMTLMPISQISDGQPQAPKSTTVAPVTVISDGQPQAPKVTTTSTTTSTTPKSTVAPVSVISDGQPQAPKVTTTSTTPKSTVAPVTQSSDGQPGTPKSTATPVPQVSTTVKTTITTMTTVTTKAPSSTTSSTAAAPTSTTGPQMVACQTNGTLALTLANGILKDSHGRTGYIASNYQFQFDNPPQAGALFTAGFSVCSNGSLALGGSNVFYQCLSGNFYNLYNKNWAPQCSPVTINALMLIHCSS